MVNPLVIARLANRCRRLLQSRTRQRPPAVTTGDFELLGSYYGEGYGQADSFTRETLDLVEDQSDLRLDPTYTGKTIAALRGESQRLNLDERTVLYWHTLNQVNLDDRVAAADPSALPRAYREFVEPDRG
jgi:1-aminocyclopropane-1-carboxylate deaminase/D-cysteine desulfhydrase-like pyridoxal-dependent ACC family enzyme